ncbi:MAG: BON domain-containing protein, partial [Gammaproteobacteria bacterium]|nr:BON domain-containing protein [Gammaproteobacteria bacterium]
MLLLDEGAIDVQVEDGIVELGGSVPTRTEARLLEELARRVDGVIRLQSAVRY